MIRIVLDTNVFISALLQPNGLPAEILAMALAGERVRLCVSAPIYSEYEEVIRRPRFRRSEQEIADALACDSGTRPLDQTHAEDPSVFGS